jgi:hypothetical protein
MTWQRSSDVTKRNVKIEQAIAALLLGEFPNINQAAKYFKLNYGTLRN